jgi:hypothetical protein
MRGQRLIRSTLDRRVLGWASAGAIALHTGAIGGVVAAREWHIRHERAAQAANQRMLRMQKAQRSVSAQVQRGMLITEARTQIRMGELELGEFILRANEIDAWEKREALDIRKARAVYRKNLESFNAALDEGTPILESLNESLGEPHYEGIPGGTMAEGLLSGGGSCEQLTHMIAAMLYDSGYEKWTFIRVYGAGKNGYGHAAPIVEHKGQEYDMTTGSKALEKGVRIRADMLVELYAQANGLSETGSEGEARGIAGSSRSSGFIYPHTEESFPGSAPLFSTKAMGGGIGTSDSSKMSLPSLPMRTLNTSPMHELEEDAMRTSVLYRPSDKSITVLSTGIEAAVQKLGAVPEDHYYERILRMGNLAGLYRRAERELTIAGRHHLAKEARNRRLELVKQAEATYEEQDRCRRESGNSRFCNAHDEKLFNQTTRIPEYRIKRWNVLFLGELGERMVFEYPMKLDRYMRIALLANRRTSEKAVQMISEMEVEDQCDLVLLYLSHAIIVNAKRMHVNDFLDDGDTDFHKAVKAMISVNRRYPPARRFTDNEVSRGTDALRPPDFDEYQAALREEFERQGLDQRWDEGIIYLSGDEALRGFVFQEEYMGGLIGEKVAAHRFMKRFNEWLTDPGRREFRDKQAAMAAADYILESGGYNFKIIVKAWRKARALYPRQRRPGQ